MFVYIIYAVTSVLSMIALIVYLYPISKNPSTVPGLEPVSKKDGNLGDIARNGSLHGFLLNLHKQFGPIASFWWGPKYVVSIANDALFKEHHSVFDRPKHLFEFLEPLIGPKCILYANGTDGRARRNLYDKCLTHNAVKKYYLTFQEIANYLAKKWEKNVEGEYIPLTQSMMTIALKSVLASFYGEKMKSDTNVLEFHEIYVVVLEVIENSMKEPMSESDLKKLIDVLSWCFYFLATHEDIQEKVFKEIKAVLGDEDLNHTNILDLVYLRQVIDETFRCAVIAPWAARFQNFDAELGGHKISKNTPVLHALGVASKNETVFPLPDRYDPDRFSPENKKHRPHLAFSPFGFAGKRVCPGQHFAYAEGTVVLVTLIRKFKVNMVEGQVIEPVYGLVTHPSDEIWITLSKR